jgi:hypothetical protein
MTKPEEVVVFYAPYSHYQPSKEFSGVCIYPYPRGEKSWWLKGIRHRDDGPAREFEDSTVENGYSQWWFLGIYVYDNLRFINLKGNYVVLERGIPTDKTFGKLKLTQAKLLTAHGAWLVYDNLPGLDIAEGNQ